MHLRLHHRIVIPFVVVAVATTSAAAFVALSLIRRALESRVVAQVVNASAVISRSEFALNASILRTAKEIVGADFVTYTTTGTILAGTVDPEPSADLVTAVIAPEPTREALSAPKGAMVLRQITCAGVPCYVAYTRVDARPNTVVAAIAQTSELRAATDAMTRTLVLAVALALFVMVLVGQILARRVTAPLEDLVRFAQEVSPGVSRRRARAARDEVGRLAAAFNEMLDRLEHAQDALVRSEKLAVAGVLAARVAHDIRNPLSSIKMQTQLLRSRADRDEDESMLDAVLRDIDQVESVVQGLLEVARPGELNRRPAQFDDVVREALRQMAAQLAHTKITVSAQFAASSLPGILLDADRFKQAVRNVIVNAADAMPQGGTLSVMTRSMDAGSTLVLEICDDGIGVDPSVVDRVFDPFVSTKREGVGLGLVNTKAVVEQHGGRISLRPREPKGTCVTISLPVGAGGPRSGSETSHG